MKLFICLPAVLFGAVPAFDMPLRSPYNIPHMKRLKLIANPAAGRGVAKTAAVRAAGLFKARGAAVDLEFTTGPNQAADIARGALAGFDVIIVVGGDGTVNEVLPALLHTGKPLGIIPAGSGNDFIKALHIPKDIAKAVEVVLAGDACAIDAGRINGRYFANAVGIGFDAAVNRESSRINGSRRGIWLYVCALVKTLGRYEPVRLRIALNGAVLEEDVFLLTVGNGTTVGGGFKLTPHAQVDDGMLDMTVVKPLSIPKLLWHLPKVFLGTIDRAIHYAQLTRITSLTVSSEGPIPVHVDGEHFASRDNTYRIEVISQALTVIRGTSLK